MFECQPEYQLTGSCSASFGVVLMLVGRVLAGCASGATTVVVPIYLGELAPPHVRGTLGVMFQVACVAAMLVAQVLGLPTLLGTQSLWPMYILGGVLLPSLAQLALRSRLPESPHWLAGRSAAEGLEAERSQHRVHGVGKDRECSLTRHLEDEQSVEALPQRLSGQQAEEDVVTHAPNRLPAELRVEHG